MNKLQTIFNKIARHLLKQNERSLLGNPGNNDCAYRNSNGLKCAAGCLISNKDYDFAYEGKDWRSTPWADNYTDEQNSLICALQEIHDYRKCRDWKQELRDLLAKYELKMIPELK